MSAGLLGSTSGLVAINLLMVSVGGAITFIYIKMIIGFVHNGALQV